MSVGPTMELYERDFYAWTQDQAAALRRVDAMRMNLPGVDALHLAEEIEDVGNDTLEKIEGLVAQIILHLLKLEFCPDEEPRRHWRAEIAGWRAVVRRRSRRSPTAAERLDLDELTADVVRQLRLRYTKASWAGACPDCCPYVLAEILDDAFVPANRHGVGQDEE